MTVLFKLLNSNPEVSICRSGLCLRSMLSLMKLSASADNLKGSQAQGHGLENAKLNSKP